MTLDVKAWFDPELVGSKPWFDPDWFEAATYSAPGLIPVAPPLDGIVNRLVPPFWPPDNPPLAQAGLASTNTPMTLTVTQVQTPTLAQRTVGKPLSVTQVQTLTRIRDLAETRS